VDSTSAKLGTRAPPSSKFTSIKLFN